MAKRGGRSGRKYVRDSIGRFATTGATARGGRLKTKSGKKRATQTVKAKTGGKPSGAIKGKIKRDPGAAKPAAAKRKKTDLQRMQQADRIMGKLAKRQKAVVDKAPSLNEGLKQVRRNNARAARVNQSLASKGLLAKYTRLTAPADPIRMTPAGKGIPKSRKAKPAVAKPAKRKTVNTSGASFERRRALAEPKVAANRRLKAEASRPLQFSGKKAGGKADQLFNDKVAQASYNRQRASEGVAARARRFYDGASQFYSAFSDRPRYSTIRKPAKDAGQWSSSSQSAWSNDLRKRRTGKRRFG